MVRLILICIFSFVFSLSYAASIPSEYPMSQYVAAGINTNPSFDKGFTYGVSLIYNKELVSFNKWVSIAGEFDTNLILLSSTKYSSGYPKSKNNNAAFSLLPVININITQNFAINLAIGLGYLANNYVSSDELDDKQSTNFNFSDNIGITYKFDNRLVIMTKLNHLSNASIMGPNPGINLFIASIGYQF